MAQHKILVLGQTPPPYGGQALMVKTLLDGQYENAKLYHVRLDFSKDFNDMGSFKIYKVWALFKAIILCWVYRFRYGADVLYYGPAGPNKFGVLRDILLLAPIRFIFKKTIIHTHAGGSSRLYRDFNFFLKFLYRAAFFKPDALITLTNYSHGDDVLLKPKNVFVVPNGIYDAFPSFENDVVLKDATETIFLYVGAMYEERGTGLLVESAKLLKQKGFKFKIHLVGIFISAKYEAELRKKISDYDLIDTIMFLGTRINDDKWREYQKADVFCFPTYVPSETFGIVLIEAMQFKMPIIASRWNGIPNVVVANENALLVNPNDVVDLTDKMQLLIEDKNLRSELGNNGRAFFLDKYSIKTFYKNMDAVFSVYE